MNVRLFKFKCNIFIGVRIIEEMPGLVASGTPCICAVLPCFDTLNMINKIQNTMFQIFT